MFGFPICNEDFYMECLKMSGNFRPPKTSTNQYWFYTECFEKNGTIHNVYMMFNRKRTVKDKFLYVHNLLKKYHKLPLALINVVNKKNNEVARKMRNTGNERFNEKLFENAFFNYNASIMMAEIGSTEFALAVANRSAVLFYKEKYDACIRDIHYAITNGYPSQLAYKLYERELKCLEKMGKLSEAKSKLQKFFSCLSQSSLGKMQKNVIVTDILNLLNNSKQEEITNNKDEKIEIQLSGGPNKNIPSLSEYVNIGYSESMGRSLVATADICPGDVLAIEKPYAGTLNFPTLKYNCRYCFKRCLNSLPCPTCSWATYCDENCRNKSYENGHKYECAIMTTLVTMHMGPLEFLSCYTALTSICKLGLDKYIDAVCALKRGTTDPMTRGFNTDGKYLSDQFVSAYTLEGKNITESVGSTFWNYCHVAVMVQCMKLAGIKIPNHKLCTVGESLIHLLFVIRINAYNIIEYFNFNNSEKYMNVVPVGYLVMPVLSLLNHQCDYNVIRHNYDGTIVLRAIRPIKKGSQLFCNYDGIFYTKQTKIVRQDKLKKNYGFRCQCVACTENWPLEVLTNEIIPERLSTMNANEFEIRSIKLQEIVKEVKSFKRNNVSYLPFLYSQMSFLYDNVMQPSADYRACQEAIEIILATTFQKFVIKDT